MRRVFWLSFGLGLGGLVGAATMRRISRAGRAMTPASLGARGRRGVEAFGERATRALEAGRQAAAEREAKLRTAHDVPSLDEALGTDRT